MSSPDEEIRGLRVLIVDDDESFCRILHEVLASFGCRPEYAGSAVEARRMLKSRHFDVLLLDYKLPGTDGISLLRALREEMGELRMPVIAISGHTDPRAEERFLALGGLAWLYKPFPSWQLVEKLADAAKSLHPGVGVPGVAA